MIYDPLVVYEDNLEPEKEGEIDKGNIHVKALGHSGKILINQITIKDNKTEENPVTLDFSYLKELDELGNEIGKSGNTKHSFNNFAQLDFSITKNQEVKYQNLSTTNFNIQAVNIQDANTKFTGNIYLFNEEGDIKNGDETSAVEKSNFKLSIDIENWKFCTKDGAAGSFNECLNGQNREIGKYLEFAMEIKGRDVAKDNGNNKFLLGGSDLILFQEVSIDGSFTKMANGYPKFSN